MKSSNNFGEISYLKIFIIFSIILIGCFGIIYEFNQQNKDIRKIVQLLFSLPFVIILIIPLFNVVRAGFVYKIIDDEIIFRDGSKFKMSEIDHFDGYPNFLGYDVKFKINENEIRKSILYSKHSFGENVRMLNEFRN